MLALRELSRTLLLQKIFIKSDFATDITETEITLKVKLYKNFTKLYHKRCISEGSGSNFEQIILKDNIK